MRKLKTSQKVALGVGIVWTGIGFYGKWAGWAYDDYFVFFYTGMTFVWIAFLDTHNRCERALFRKIFAKKPSKNTYENN